MHDIVVLALLVTGVLIFVASLDDILVDILTLRRVRNREILPAPADGKEPELPSIAVFVANWHEADVLEQMVEGNLANITNPSVRFVVGVYPNDVETRAIAEGLAEKHPDRVQVIVNRRSGPTSKGQMLNEMFRTAFRDRANAPDLVVMHDSEDIIAPRSFEVHAREAKHSAMIQIPVFSLDARDRSTVAATYMEEFAERHTREMILRAQIGACIPSAGVGTCLRKDLILHFLDKRGHVLQADSVTEDYLLGTEAHRDGFKTTFAAVKDGTSPNAPFIATLEYFPKSFWASVKQKTRWVYGIAFQATKRIGWSGNAWDIFFLYRDRKGAIANLLPLISLFILFAGLMVGANAAHLPPWQKYLLWFVLAGNTFSIFVRLYFKAIAFREVYGANDILGIFLRWPVGILVNAVAVARAWRMFIVDSRLASRPVAWAKTRHELPAVFRPLALIEPAKLAAARGRGFGRYLLEPSGSGLAVVGLTGTILLLGGYAVMQSALASMEAERARTAAIESLNSTAMRDETILAFAEETRRARPYVALAETAETAEEEKEATEEWSLRVAEDREAAHTLAKLILAQPSDDDVLENVAQRLQELPSDYYLTMAAEQAQASDPPVIITLEEREHAHGLAKQSLATIAAADTAYLETASINRPAPSLIAPGAADLAAELSGMRTELARLVDDVIEGNASQDRSILEHAASAKPDPGLGAAPEERAVMHMSTKEIDTREVAASAASATTPIPDAEEIRAMQRAVNRWLQKHRLTVRDLGMTKLRSHCGRILCVDGIMGPRTIHVLSEIKRRDSAFEGNVEKNKG